MVTPLRDCAQLHLTRSAIAAEHALLGLLITNGSGCTSTFHVANSNLLSWLQLRASARRRVSCLLLAHDVSAAAVFF